jgi:MinD superfamily P-loop ATPase
MGIKVAIASGKGGTGKTTLAASLSVVLAKAGREVVYLDCDVEEPNGHLFLRPKVTCVIDVRLPFPEVDPSVCTLCGICADLCEFRAIAITKERVLFFNDLCHNCGLCYYLCPVRAINEVQESVGKVIVGIGNGVGYVGGELKIGVARAPAIIEATRRQAPAAEITILDAPPGTSCPAVHSVKNTDFVILVTEPTPFGFNDLLLAIDMLRVLDLPFAVVLNRADIGYNRVVEYCRSEGIDILMDIPDDREIAEAYSRGRLLLAERPDHAKRLQELFGQIENRVKNAGCSCTQR